MILPLVYGKAIMNIQLGDKHVRHIVAEIANEWLIGTDFLRAHGIVIDFANNKVTSGGVTIIAKCQEGQEQACRVSAKEAVVVPAGTQTIIEGRTSKPLATGSWIIEPLTGKRIEEEVLLARVMIQRRRNLHACRSHESPRGRCDSIKEHTSGDCKQTTQPCYYLFPGRERFAWTSWRDYFWNSKGAGRFADKIEVEVDYQEKSQIRELIKNHHNVFS